MSYRAGQSNSFCFKNKETREFPGSPVGLDLVLSLPGPRFDCCSGNYDRTDHVGWLIK